MFLMYPSAALFILLFLGVSSGTSEDGQMMLLRIFNPGVSEDYINMSKRSYSPYAFRGKQNKMLNKLLVKAGLRFLRQQPSENNPEALKKQTFSDNQAILMDTIQSPRRVFGISYGRG